MKIVSFLSENGTVVINGVETPAQIEFGSERGGPVIERLSIATFSDAGEYTGQIHVYNENDALLLGVQPLPHDSH